MAEKIRLTDEQKEENNQNIAKIVELTNQIKAIVPLLHGKACNEAYANSVSNLETKNEKYVSQAPFQVSEEEKELLAKFRAGNLIVKEKKI